MNEPFDLDALMQQAMAMQRELADAQEQAAATEVEGSAGGGSVTVRMTGAGEVTAVHIAPEVVDPEEVELLEDLVVAALRDAGQRVAELQTGALGDLAGLGDFDLGGLGGLTGLSGPDDQGFPPGLAPGEPPGR